MSAKPYDKDVKFLIKAVILAAIVMFTLHVVVKPILDGPDPKAEAIREYTRQIQSIRAAEVPSIIKAARGKPTFLFIYASWCGYCKTLMPDIIQMIRDKKMEGFNLLFFSLDFRYGALSSYIIHNEYEGIFTPYLVKHGSVNTLTQNMTSLGARYQGSVPYTAVLNADGKIIAEFLGIMDKGELSNALNQVKL